MKILLALFIMFVFVNSMVQDETQNDNKVETSFLETEDHVRHSLVSSHDSEDDEEGDSEEDSEEDSEDDSEDDSEEDSEDDDGINHKLSIFKSFNFNIIKL